MRFLTAFFIVLVGVVFFMLPLSDALYNWKTDTRTDVFTIATAAATTNASVTLHKAIYDNDTSTLSFTSNVTTDTPSMSGYTSATHVLGIQGLTANSTRLINVSYDVTAFNQNTALETFADIIPYLCYIFFVLFICGGIVYAFLPQIKEWLT